MPVSGVSPAGKTRAPLEHSDACVEAGYAQCWMSSVHAHATAHLERTRGLLSVTGDRDELLNLITELLVLHSENFVLGN